MFTEDLDRATSNSISDKPSSTEEIPGCTLVGSDGALDTPTGTLERSNSTSKERRPLLSIPLQDDSPFSIHNWHLNELFQQ